MYLLVIPTEAEESDSLFSAADRFTLKGVRVRAGVLVAINF